MDSLVFGLIALVCSLAGIACGMSLRVFLPEEHLSDESKSAVKLGTGMIATLGAIVLGLLIGSAKGTFDTVSAGLKETGLKLVLLDRTLDRYGPETAEIRSLLRHYTIESVRRYWPEDGKLVASMEEGSTRSASSRDAIEDLQDRVRSLSPKGENGTQLRSRALQIANDLDQTRWLLFEQRGMSSLPRTFLAIVVCWFSMIFTSFGLLAPRNTTVMVVLFLCALSVSCALFLMLELDHPYGGIVKVRSIPLVNALHYMGK